MDNASYHRHVQISPAKRQILLIKRLDVSKSLNLSRKAFSRFCDEMVQNVE